MKKTAHLFRRRRLLSFPESFVETEVANKFKSPPPLADKLHISEYRAQVVCLEVKAETEPSALRFIFATGSAKEISIKWKVFIADKS